MDNLLWYHLGKKRGGGGSCSCPSDLVVESRTALLDNPAMEFAYSTPEDGEPAYVALFAAPTGIEAGETYRVVVDGEESTVTAVEMRQELSPEMVMTMVGLGNLALMFPGFEDTGEQFAVQEMYLNGEYQSGGMCVPLNGSTAETVTYSVGIYADAVKINETYLPEEWVKAQVEQYVGDALGGEY